MATLRGGPDGVDLEANRLIAWKAVARGSDCVSRGHRAQSPMPIRPLTPADAPLYLALRREMLADSPWAFASSPEDPGTLDLALIAARLADPDQAIFAAFDDAPPVPHLLGTVGVYRHRRLKTAHRAGIRGVYVTPSARNRGLTTSLLTAALGLTRTWPGITSVALSVSENSPTARHVYERLGFVAWGREPAAIFADGRAYDEIHMVKFFRAASGLPA